MTDPSKSRTTCTLAALLLLVGAVSATPQELLAHDLQFEGSFEESRRVFELIGVLAPFSQYVEHDVLGIRVEYSTTFRGNEVTVSGLVVIPFDLETPAPILVWNHGTIFDEDSAPSSWTHPTHLQLVPALNGMITFLPDYVGYGASSDLIHPYILSDGLVASVIDMIHAGREFIDEEGIPFSDELHIWGFSEGGYVALATAHELDTNEKHGLLVTEVNAISGPYDILAAAEMILSDKTYPIPAYGAFMLAAYNDRYWQRPLSDFFQEPHAGLVERFSSRKAGLALLAGSMPGTVGELMSPAFAARFEGAGEDDVKAALEANAIPAWAPDMPVYLHHGTHDRDVPYALGEKQYKAMLAVGADPERLTFLTYEGADHSATVFKAVSSFFERQP